MGFSIVVEKMIECMKNKPLIGHNQMYDMLYFYKQFIGPLPSKYLEFIQKWEELFPLTYDTKVLAFKSGDLFSKTILQNVFESS